MKTELVKSLLWVTMIIILMSISVFGAQSGKMMFVVMISTSLNSKIFIPCLNSPEFLTLIAVDRQGPNEYTVYILSLAKMGKKCHLVPVGYN